jgi:transposase
MDKLELPQIPSEVLQNCPKQVQEYVAALQTIVGQLVTQLSELQSKLDQNSQNSSKPPSADPPFKRPPKNTNHKTKSDKPKGGQVGHPKHQRTLLEPDQVDLIVTPPPPACANPQCKARLRASDQLGEVLRHQLWELPIVKAHVTEYQLPNYECSLCQTITPTPWPKQVPKGQFGPNLVATLAVLHGQYQLSLRQTQELAVDLWQLPLSLGGIADACTKTSQALQKPLDEVQNKVQTSTTVQVDETGWYRAGKLKWLWVAVSKLTTRFQVHPGRGKTEFEALIGKDYQGYLHSDRWHCYLNFEATRHQLCWAHLIRNLRGLSQRAGPAKKWGEAMLLHAQKLFEVWHHFVQKADEAERDWLKQEVEPVRAAFKTGLERGQSLPDGCVTSFCKKLLKVEERLYLFVKVAGISPTNNTAERALRPAVIWRKKCYGNQSAGGEEFVERVLSVRATCQQHQRNFLNFVRECLKAKWFSLPTPQLFPLPSPL